MLNFNPRTPCGVRPGTGDAVPDHQDFNPRTPCGVRLWTRLHSRSVTCISIHAPRAGCDSDPASRPSHRAHFNPRTPCGVRRCRSRPTRRSRRTFQSTHPVRGATRSRAEDQAGQEISIHAPRAGCDAARRTLSAVSAHFNPRTPCGVRRRPPAPSPAPPYFNPRTPCGVRLDPARISCFCANFNPRTPCGVRPHQSTTAHKMGDFNPRTPCGVRLIVSKVDTGGEPFQSTYPVRGATAGHSRRWKPCRFQSTYPVRGATRNTCNRLQGVRISIHVPRAGCDLHRRQHLRICLTFQSTYPVRGATCILIFTVLFL